MLDTRLRPSKLPRNPLLALGLACLVAGPAAQGVLAQDGTAGSAGASGHDFGVEIKGSYRDSDAVRFPVPFPQEDLPEGVPGLFLETVEPGEQFEVSTATVFYRGTWGEEDRWAAKAKVDLIDRHDRNPTSSDREWDVDELWIRWGPEREAGDNLLRGMQDGYSVYAKLGKFPKFERQDDRHLESYGLLSTSFNRMEDVGLELGFDLGRYFYLKASFTQGNPVFIRDPNALAGDNGTPEIAGLPNTVPELGSGVVILYDADVDDVDFENPETSLGLGVRFGNDLTWSFDALFFASRRDLAETVELHGTFYGGDRDTLDGPAPSLSLPVVGNEKEEYGVSLWLYAGGLTVFGQYVEQELAGLVRDGFEVEVAYDFELPYFGALFGRQVLPWIAPAVRYSEMDPQFVGATGYPAPSVWWDWEKLDIGVRLGLIQGMLDMTVEYADNEFIRGGKTESADELLATFRFMWDWSPTPSAF